MTIVDVNTGKSVGKTNLEETVVNTNLEAAKEVARQLRLRDIGGIIVVDFIDMLLEKNKKQVEDTMKEAMAVDKTQVAGVRDRPARADAGHAQACDRRPGRIVLRDVPHLRGPGHPRQLRSVIPGLIRRWRN